MVLAGQIFIEKNVKLHANQKAEMTASIVTIIQYLLSIYHSSWTEVTDYSSEQILK